ncbi:hypothetical protein SAMN05660493_01503 [Epilithonimonas bovis DSM 19482]|uniref:Uncharacterized protein n=1 Tax=Epilithonimonas bovis DSM 19482 TaxID=1121284 RepID=A0A1U7PYG0_9FLAO|nr:hypothetical protein SAMN05660493_01503 [Epilithonimonas bovis DSM 19482]
MKKNSIKKNNIKEKFFWLLAVIFFTIILCGIFFFFVNPIQDQSELLTTIWLTSISLFIISVAQALYFKNDY